MIPYSLLEAGYAHCLRARGHSCSSCVDSTLAPWPSGIEPMSPCLLLLRGATGTHCSLWPFCQRSLPAHVPAIFFLCHWSGEPGCFRQQEKIRLTNLCRLPAFWVSHVPLSKWERRKQDKKRKMAELPQLRHKTFFIQRLLWAGKPTTTSQEKQGCVSCEGPKVQTL